MGLIVSGSRWLWCKCLKLSETGWSDSWTNVSCFESRPLDSDNINQFSFLLPSKILQSHLLTLKSYWVHEKNLLMTCWWLAQQKWYELSVSYPDSYLSESKMNPTNKPPMTQILCVVLKLPVKARHLLNQFNFIWLCHTTGRRICLTKQEFHCSRCLLRNYVFLKIAQWVFFTARQLSYWKVVFSQASVCHSVCERLGVSYDRYP